MIIADQAAVHYGHGIIERSFRKQTRFLLNWAGGGSDHPSTSSTWISREAERSMVGGWISGGFKEALVVEVGPLHEAAEG